MVPKDPSLTRFKPYYQQVGLDSHYFTEDDFNESLHQLNTRFSLFHLNIRSLNKHHNDLVIYLSLLNNKFDAIRSSVELQPRVLESNIS